MSSLLRNIDKEVIWHVVLPLVTVESWSRVLHILYSVFSFDISEGLGARLVHRRRLRDIELSLKDAAAWLTGTRATQGLSAIVSSRCHLFHKTSRPRGLIHGTQRFLACHGQWVLRVVEFVFGHDHSRLADRNRHHLLGSKVELHLAVFPVLYLFFRKGNTLFNIWCRHESSQGIVKSNFLHTIKALSIVVSALPLDSQWGALGRAVSLDQRCWCLLIRLNEEIKGYSDGYFLLTGGTELFLKRFICSLWGKLPVW